MSTAKSPIPEGYHTVTPYLVVADAAKAIEFYRQSFDAAEIFRLNLPDGKVAHAEIQIGTSRIMLSDENPQWGTRGAKSLGGSPVSLMIYVPDCDAVFQRAVAAGATVVMPVTDQFYGDRSGTVEDPAGHKWHISTHKESLTKEEVERRMVGMFDQK